MAVSKETLRNMLVEFGGLSMSDEELDQAVLAVQAYLDSLASIENLDLANVMPAQMFRAQQGF